MTNIINQPFKYTPAGNPVLFTLSGTNRNLVLFNIQLEESSTGEQLYTGNIYPTFSTPSTQTVNLSKYLSSLVKYDVDNDLLTPIEGKPQTIISYQLTATEGYATNNGLIILDTTGTTTSDVFYSFDGQMDIVNFTNSYTDDKYLMKVDGSNTSFLTLQPDYKPTNGYANEQLYFLQDGMEGIRMIFNYDNDTDYVFTLTGDTTHSLENQTAPETRAFGRVSITGTSAVGDNIGVFANGQLLGSFTLINTIVPSEITNLLYHSVLLNDLGYDTELFFDDSFRVYAPVGMGASGNSISLTTALISSASTSVAITAATQATAFVTGYSLPDTTSTTNIEISLQNGTFVGLGQYLSTTADTTDDIYTTNVVAVINAGSLGFTAVKNTSNKFTVTAPVSYGDTINGAVLYLQNNGGTGDGDPTLYLGGFGGGVTLGTGYTTTAHSIIPNTLSGFTGGVDAKYSLSRMVRLNVSPKAILANPDFMNLSPFINGETIRVWITNLTGETISKVFNYVYTEPVCTWDLVNVLYVNSFGGVDTIQLINPQESVNITKQTIERNGINLNSPTPFLTNNKFNVTTETYNTTTKSTVSLYTQPLTDSYAKYLPEFMNSKQHYFELNNGQLLPVQLTTNNYNIQRNKYLKNQLNQFQFQFTLSDSYLPSLDAASYIINS